MHDEQRQTGTHAANAGRRLLAALTLTVVALAIGAFTLSFDALRALAVTAGVTAHLAWLWPLIVDGFIVIATAAAVMLRDRGWRVAWYPWATLVLFAGVSVAGNAHHAASHADRTAVSVSIAALVSAVPAVALLLASHLLVVLLTPSKPGEAQRKATLQTARHASTPAEHKQRVAISDSHPLPPPVRPAPRRPTRGDAHPAVNQHDLEAWIATRLDRGESVTGNSVARHLDCSPATGRRRLAALKQANPELARRLNRETADHKVVTP